MIDLTVPEVKALLWVDSVVRSSLGNGAGVHADLDSARRKLLDELALLESDAA